MQEKKGDADKFGWILNFRNKYNTESGVRFTGARSVGLVSDTPNQDSIALKSEYVKSIFITTYQCKLWQQKNRKSDPIWFENQAITNSKHETQRLPAGNEVSI